MVKLQVEETLLLLVFVVFLVYIFVTQILPEWQGKECKEWKPRRYRQWFDSCVRWE